MPEPYQPRHARVQQRGTVLVVDGVTACTAHRPTQHRDGKPPWCRACGLDAAGTKPPSRIRP